MNANYINDLFTTLKQMTADTSYAGYIEVHMQSGSVTFAELNFTEEEFRTSVKRIKA